MTKAEQAARIEALEKEKAELLRLLGESQAALIRAMSTGATHWPWSPWPAAPAPQPPPAQPPMWPWEPVGPPVIPYSPFNPFTPIITFGAVQ